MTTPRATYRLQLTADLPFAAATAMVPYLRTLGISHLYLSPVLAARPGTRHFYDVADHRRVDPVLGGEEGLRELAHTAHQAGMGLIGDIVPHHMSAGPWSPVWDMLLREGRSGDAAKHFDIDWESPLPGAREKVILPVLDGPYGDVLAAGDIGLAQTPTGVRITYGELSFPLNSESDAAVERSDVTMIEGRADEPRSWSRMHSLLEQQHYRLVSWRAGNRLVNYRRFLAVNALAALRVDDPMVFEATSRTMIDLVTDGTLDGLRVDHVDGLADPTGYLRRLREAVGPDAWLVVQKFTSPSDPLHHDWPVDGTTGYELLRTSLGLQIDHHGMRHLGLLAAAHGAVAEPHDVVLMKQHQLDELLGPDLRRVVRVVWNACQDEPAVRDVDYRTLLEAVSRILTSMDVYRTYVDVTDGTADDRDRAAVQRVVQRARVVTGRGNVPDALWRYLGDLLCGDVRWTASAAEAVTRFQQLSGPVMALGVEERLFLRHNVMPAACELGCDPMDATVDRDRAHELIRAMPPQGMRTTATHDTVHSEEVRLRMAALSGMAAPWTAVADRILSGTAPPDSSLGLRLLQVAVAVWPIEDDGRIPLAELLDRPVLVQRLVDHAIAVARGQGVITSHLEVDEDVEGQLAGWVRALLDPRGGVAGDLRHIALRTAEVGMASSLSQTLLRLAVPGVPDTYQGTERWDDSLSDPDNRRDPDVHLLVDTQRSWAAGKVDVADLWTQRRDGRVKQWVVQQALTLRAAHPQVLGPDGAYTPLDVRGRWADHVLAFARSAPGAPTVVVVCPRNLGRVTDGGNFPPVGRIWADTELALPGPGLGVAEGTPWHEVLSGHTVDAVAGAADAGGTSIALAELMSTLPVALLVAGDPHT